MNDRVNPVAVDAHPEQAKLLADKFSFEVTGARALGTDQNGAGMYRATSNEHLPVVLIGSGSDVTRVGIDRGNTFSVSENTPQSVVVQQFDTKSGKLVARDNVVGDMDDHIVFSPLTGLRVSETETSRDKAGVTREVTNYDAKGQMSSESRISPNGTFHGSYNAVGKLVAGEQSIFESGNHLGQHISYRVAADGRDVSVHSSEGSGHPDFADVVGKNHSYTQVFFDPATHRPAEEMVMQYNATHFFQTNRQTGRTTEDTAAEAAYHSGQRPETIIEHKGLLK